jgi:hypothetical protein
LAYQNISPQLSFLSIVRSEPLLARIISGGPSRYKSSEEKPKFWVLEGCFWLIGPIIMFVGLLVGYGVYGTRRKFGVAIVLVGWLTMLFHDEILSFTENASASFGSFCVSAASYRRAENVRVIPIVVPELKFSNVQRQILPAHLVEASHDAARSMQTRRLSGSSLLA